MELTLGGALQGVCGICRTGKACHTPDLGCPCFPQRLETQQQPSAYAAAPNVEDVARAGGNACWCFALR